MNTWKSGTKRHRTGFHKTAKWKYSKKCKKKVQRWLNKCFFPSNKSAPIYNDAFKNAQLPGAEDTILPTNSSVWKETFFFSIKLKFFFVSFKPNPETFKTMRKKFESFQFKAMPNSSLRKKKPWKPPPFLVEIHHQLCMFRRFGSLDLQSAPFQTTMLCVFLFCHLLNFSLCDFFFCQKVFPVFFSGYLDGLVFFSTPSKSDPFSFPCLNFDNPWYAFYFASVLVLGIWCLPPQQRGVWWLLLDRSFRVLNKWCGQPIPSKQSKYPAGVRRLQTRNTQR